MKRTLAIGLTVVFASVLVQLGTLGADSKATAPATAPTTAPVVEVQADGSLLLKAEGARIIGSKLHLELKPVPTLIFWVDPKESIEWPKAVASKGKYEVEITYSCPQNAGGAFVVAAAASKVTARTVTTADWQTFRTAKLGTVSVVNDNTTISVRPVSYFERALMNVRCVKLTPVAETPEKEKK